MTIAHMTNRKKMIINFVLKLPNALTVYLKSDVGGAMTAFLLQGLNYGKHEQTFFLLHNTKTSPEANTVSYQWVLGGYSHSTNLEATLIMHAATPYILIAWCSITSVVLTNTVSDGIYA